MSRSQGCCSAALSCVGSLTTFQRVQLESTCEKACHLPHIDRHKNDVAETAGAGRPLGSEQVGNYVAESPSADITSPMA